MIPKDESKRTLRKIFEMMSQFISGSEFICFNSRFYASLSACFVGDLG